MTQHVVMVAAENGALPKGKVGGIGDVIRDLPGSLADRGWRVTVVTPSYGMFASLPGARPMRQLTVEFAGQTTQVGLFEVPGLDKRITHLVLDHADFSPGGQKQIYHDDGPEEPFKTDSSKFALFCVSAASLLCELSPDVVHLHDWHTGLLLALRQYDRRFAALKPLRTCFTIHNLAMQGIRPLKGHEASLDSWIPENRYPRDVVADPRYPDCFNPMLTAIRLADAVHTVSPTYAQEVCLPNRPGFHGGEGMEQALSDAGKHGRLFGILNGCAYAARPKRKLGWKRLLKLCAAELTRWIADERWVPSAHLLATQRIPGLPTRRPGVVLTSVGRITAQKVQLLLQPTPAGPGALTLILERLGTDGVFVMLGSGDARLEQALTKAAAEHENFLFLRGYSDAIAQALYQAGDLFMMPSSFEPCGISQMLAMQAGQPCLVHAVGGLKDTVQHLETGFVFGGDSPMQQAGQLVVCTDKALLLKESDPTTFKQIRDRAAAARFTWDKAVAGYEKHLYAHHD